MKFKVFILLLILFLPFAVSAKDCDLSKITISSIEQKNIEGNTEEIEEPTITGKNIKFNLKMYEVGDSITYDVTIKNDTKTNYMIDKDTFKTDSEYIEYSLKVNDNTNAINAKSSKVVSLTIIYKNKIDKSLLTNNIYDASNSLTFSINANEKEETLVIITTDDPNDIKNPFTSSNSVILLLLMFLMIGITVYLNISNKRKSSKYIVLILSLFLIPNVYAICKDDIKVNSTIVIEYKPTLNETIVDLSGNTPCITKYEKEVTDQVGVTTTASNVYFDRCVDQRNVILGNFCWQVIRTTETGGTKLIYNGEPVDGKCERTRGDHIGIVGKEINYISDIDANTMDISGEYLYGSSFTYDKTNSTFTLIDSHLDSWSDSTYESLLGKYTCLNTTGTCTKLYNVNSYETNTYATTASYTIGSTNYAQIGTTAFNGSNKSPAMAGYMFNKVYNYQHKYVSGTTYYKFGSDVTYNNGTYTLSGNTTNLRSMASMQVKNYHYTCWNSTGECNNIAYVYYTNETVADYIILSNGEKITKALNDMLTSDNVNKYDSSIKGIIDAWYSQEFSNYTDYLEDTVFCNSRNILDYGGWNPNGGETHQKNLQFKNHSVFNYNGISNLACTNITDQLSVSNDKAKLKYPIALMTEEERYNIAPATSIDSPNLVLVKTNVDWWVLSPRSFNEMDLYNNTVDEKGLKSSYSSFYPSGARPVISIKPSVVIWSGSGSETDPWIIKET